MHLHGHPVPRRYSDAVFSLFAASCTICHQSSSGISVDVPTGAASPSWSTMITFPCLATVVRLTDSNFAAPAPASRTS